MQDFGRAFCLEKYTIKESLKRLNFTTWWLIQYIDQNILRFYLTPFSQ